ncbi:gamma-glutamyltransferase [Opitutales bacterium ASA1]|uniref:gamma-glutamyltransferase n=1 Tax=Congregicoccus parvus TaxID=3081749 RepID=UPI002B28BF86|nr:gamma-glutamyltransferase [Opitutales bacterium ASA1]
MNKVSLLVFALVFAGSTETCLAQRLPAEARHGMVASASATASEIGVDVMRRGGNAIDAAVATGFALAVTYPRAGNIGGGGFMVVRMADGRTAAIDFREVAPSRATSDMYLDANGEVVAGRSTVGRLAVGVPGTVAGLALALERYGSGRLSWRELVEPARRLAAEGFPVTPALARDLRASAKLLSEFEYSHRIFLRGGNPYEAGERFVQAELGRTLGRIAEDGPREFYEGETAAMLAADMARHGGLITLDDLRAYRPVERDVLRGAYRGYEISTMPPPSSGGIALLQMLGMIEPFDVASMGHDSAAKLHLLAEVMRRAFRDRAEFPGDPDFVSVPVEGLLARDYLRDRMADFDPARAATSVGFPAGDPVARGTSAAAYPRSGHAHESSETTHFSIVDAEGNAVACTYTLNGLFGSGVTAEGTGILLNNEMDDFTAKVGVPNLFGLIQGEANAIAPGKRPLSSMTPTIVAKDDRVYLVTGSPGGPTIINTVLQVISNVIDHGMSITQAVDAPRMHHQWMPDVINHEPFLTSRDSAELLRARGHVLAPRKLYPNDPEAAARYWGDAESILVDAATGLRLGANDLRSPDSATAGY